MFYLSRLLHISPIHFSYWFQSWWEERKSCTDSWRKKMMRLKTTRWQEQRSQEVSTDYKSLYNKYLGMTVWLQTIVFMVDHNVSFFKQSVVNLLLFWWILDWIGGVPMVSLPFKEVIPLLLFWFPRTKHRPFLVILDSPLFCILSLLVLPGFVNIMLSTGIQSRHPINYGLIVCESYI